MWSSITGVPKLRIPSAIRVLEGTRRGACSSRCFPLSACIVIIIYTKVYRACSSRGLVGLSPSVQPHKPLFVGCAQTRVQPTAVTYSVSTAFRLFVTISSAPPQVHTCGIGAAHSFVLECSLRGACSSCVIVWLSLSGGVGTAWVRHATWCGTVWHGMWCGTV